MSAYTFDKLVQFVPEELDRIYKAAFGYKTDGTFVEVGAYDGRTYSHTCGLADMGWRGVYVEPVPEIAAKCLKNHESNPKITVVEVAAGATFGRIPLYIDRFSCCGSTTNPVVCKNPEMLRVEVMPLDYILECAEISPAFDLLSIDVEFGEVAVLSGFTVKRWLPKMIMIELCETLGGEKQEWAEPARAMCKEMFEPLGYKIVHSDKLNNIYVR